MSRELNQFSPLLFHKSITKFTLLLFFLCLYFRRLWSIPYTLPWIFWELSEKERLVVVVVDNETVDLSRISELVTELRVQLSLVTWYWLQLLPNFPPKIHSLQSIGYQFGKHMDEFLNHILFFTVWSWVNHLPSIVWWLYSHNRQHCIHFAEFLCDCLTCIKVTQ